MVTGLSHVSIAVPDLEAAARQLNDKYGLNVGARMVNAEQGVRLAYVELGAAKIELMEPSRRVRRSPNSSNVIRKAASITSASALTVSRRPRMLSLRTACACWAAAGRNATSRVSRSPSSIRAIFWARWSNSKS